MDNMLTVIVPAVLVIILNILQILHEARNFKHIKEDIMSKKHGNKLSLEQQVNQVITFFNTHEWAGPIAMPLNLNKKLDSISERYYFDCYIDHRRAQKYYFQGDINQAKKYLTYSVVWGAEACDDAAYFGLNDFNIMLMDKTDDMLDDAIEMIFAGECPSKKIDPIGFSNFRLALQTSMD
jgi:hypothetical protein